MQLQTLFILDTSGKLITYIITYNGVHTETNMLEHMGLAVDTPLRDLALIESADYEAELLDFTFQGRKAPLAFRTKAKLLANLARVAFGLDYTPEQKLAWEEKRQAEEAEQQERVAQQAVQLAATLPTAPTSGRKVNMRIALQERSGEVEPISFDTMEAACDRYLAKMHTKRIPCEGEPKPDQLTTLMALLKATPLTSTLPFGDPSTVA